MSEPIQIIATLYPTDMRKAERLKELIIGVVDKVKEQEPDVLQYRMHEQLKKNPPVLLMVETYKTKDAIRKHAEMPYFKAFLKAVEEESLTTQPMTFVMAKNVTGFGSRL